MELIFSKVKSKARWTTAIFFFVSGIVTGTWASRIPEMQQKFQMNDAKWGGVLFAISVGLFIGLPISSWIVAKFTSFKIMAISAAIYAFLLCLLPLAPNIFVLVLSLFLFGISRNLLNISINTNAVEVQRFYQKPIITTFHGLWSLACLFAAGVGTIFIFIKTKPTYHFVIIAVFAIIIILICKSKRRKRNKLNSDKKPLFVKPDTYLFLLGLMAFFTMVCEGTMFDWSVNYFDKVIKTDRTLVTAGYACFIGSMTVARFIGDRLIAAFGAVKMLMTNGICIAVGFAIAVLFPYVWTACVGFLFIGFGDSILVPTIYSLAGKSTKMLPGYAIASVTFIGYIGFITAPLIVGSISTAFGMQYSFSLMILFSTCISIIAFAIRKRVAALTSNERLLV